MKRLDLTGIKFGRLTCLSFSKEGKVSKWLCLCECGNTKTVRAEHLKRGETTSCGCYRNERIREVSATHGETNSSLYRIWSAMKRRCYNKKSKDYTRYGERGISVCDRWHIYENFKQDVGFPEKGLSLERKDNNGNYEPTNVRWATAIDQARNRRSNRYITTPKGIMLLIEASNVSGLGVSTLRHRIKQGYAVSDLFKPVP